MTPKQTEALKTLSVSPYGWHYLKGGVPASLVRKGMARKDKCSITNRPMFYITEAGRRALAGVDPPLAPHRP